MPNQIPAHLDGVAGKYIVTLAPNGHPATNVLVLLHGLGDTELPFKSFAERLQLPETACISLRGTANLPFDLDGAHWGDDTLFDSNGTIDADAGFKKSAKVLGENIIRKLLIENCNYALSDIFLFGFGQGGMLALHVAAEFGENNNLGGVVSIGGPLSASSPIPETGKKSKTPVLLCHGYRQSAVRDGDVDRLKDVFKFAEIKEWRKSGDGMPASREEMLPIMQFWASKLKSRRGVPEGSVEIT